MDTQVLRTPLIVYELIDLAPSAPTQASSRDYGFDFDEEEIAREMLAPLPARFSSCVVSPSDANELDFDTLWFLS